MNELLLFWLLLRCVFFQFVLLGLWSLEKSLWMEAERGEKLLQLDTPTQEA